MRCAFCLDAIKTCDIHASAELKSLSSVPFADFHLQAGQHATGAHAVFAFEGKRMHLPLRTRNLLSPVACITPAISYFPPICILPSVRVPL